MTMFLLFCVIIIATFFTWQLVLHKKLEQTPTSCTGDLFVNNTCGVGFACVLANQSKSIDLFKIPTTSEQAVSIIDDFKKTEIESGFCIPWASKILEIPLNIEK